MVNCLAMFLQRLVQQASVTGAFYISGVTPERVEKLNKQDGLNLAVGSPITQIEFSSTIFVTDLHPKPLPGEQEVWSEHGMGKVWWSGKSALNSDHPFAFGYSNHIIRYLKGMMLYINDQNKSTQFFETYRGYV